jgi:lysozyme
LKTSQAGIDLICRFEGCRLEAYRDTTGILTIGYGHTGADVTSGLRIDQTQAARMLADDLSNVEYKVETAVHVRLNQHQFDALVSWTYNCGIGNLKTSTLLGKLNAGDYLGCAEEFPKWDRAGADVLPGLVARRAAERAMFVGGVDIS